MSNLGGNSVSEETDRSNNLQGADGADGANGTNGTDGADGQDGADGTDGAGTVISIVAGANIDNIDNTDPANPIVNAATQAGDPSPLTTKGDLYVFDTDDQRLAVGSDDQVLTADAAAATGMKWADAAAGGGGGASASNVLATAELSAPAGTIPISLDNLTEFDFDISYPAVSPAPSGIALFINGNTTDANYFTNGIDVTGVVTVRNLGNPNIGGLETAQSSHTQGTVRVVGSRVIVKTFHLQGEVKYAMRTAYFDVATTDVSTFTVSGRGTDLPTGTKVIISDPYAATQGSLVRSTVIPSYPRAVVVPFSTSSNATKSSIYDVTVNQTIDAVGVLVNDDATATYKFMVCEVSGVNHTVDVVLYDSGTTKPASTNAGFMLFDLGAAGLTLTAGKTVAFMLVRVDGTDTTACEAALPNTGYGMDGLEHVGGVVTPNKNPVPTDNLGTILAGVTLAMEVSFRVTAGVTPSVTISISNFIQGTLLNAEKLSTFIATTAFTLPASLTDSQAYAESTAASAATIDIQVNSVSKGSINFASGTNAATFTFASPISINAGDRIQLVAQATADASLADVSVTLRGTL